MNGSGLLTGLLIACIGAGGFLFSRRYGGSTALEELERANGVMERRVKQLEEENQGQARRIAELEASRDVAIAIVPVLDALRLHEERAGARSDATLAILQMIADQLGAERELT